MVQLPPFPVDDQTIDLILGATTAEPRSSIGELCTLYSELGGSDTDAIESSEASDREIVMRDPQYHPNDIIIALAKEVRRLRKEAL